MSPRLLPFLRSIARQFARPWLLPVTLVAAGILVRTPALPGDLIWDDGFLIRDNPFIKSPVLVFETFRQYLLLESLSTHYRPVQNISYMLDYWIWNSNSFGFHLSNVLWHTGSGLLLFFLLKQLLPGLLFRASADEEAGPAGKRQQLSTLLAFLLALLWVVHPVHSAAVDYISGRADSLAFFFASGAWLLYLQARRATRHVLGVPLYALSLFVLLLALCSRESACMWVIVFLLHLFFFDRAFSRRAKVLVLTGCVVTIAAYAGLRQLPERRSASMPDDGWSAPVRGVLMLRALGDYGRLMVFPSNLHMERSVVNAAGWKDNAAWRRAAGHDYLTILGLGVLAALAFGASRRGEGQPLRIFGASWFLLSYLPISNLIDLNASVAEHWLYLPSVGFLLFVAGAAIDLPRTPRRLALAVGCIAVFALGARSYVRSTDWVDDKTFYTRTGNAGGGTIRVLLNLGQIYAAEGDYSRAETLYRKALQLYPDYVIARNNLADVLFRQGKNDEAERLLQEATQAAPEASRHFPRTWAAALNLAKMHVRNSDFEAALGVLAEARKSYPKTWPLISLESELLRRTRGPAAALPAVSEFRRACWWHFEAAVAAGKLHYELGEIAEAEAAFRHASRLDVHDPSALNQIALLAINQSRLDEAYSTQRRAVARQPDEPRQYLILSDILVKMGRTDEANAVLAQVSRMQRFAQEHTAAN